MVLPSGWAQRLRVPVVAAPMTGVSGPDLVVAACTHGVVGTFPTHNASSPQVLDSWLAQMTEGIGAGTPTGAQAAPLGANLVVHRTNARLHSDLAAVVRAGVELVIASVGSPREVVGPLHDAGVLVWSDVASLRHAELAIAAGVDGLVLLTAGAGGQTGWANPISFVRAVRDRFDGTLVLAGGVSDGEGVFAAQVLGADLAYLGTSFIATEESLAAPDYKAAVVAATLDDVTTSTQVSGLAANVLSSWLADQGADAGGGFAQDRLLGQGAVWAAGHSVSGTDEVVAVAKLVDRLVRDHQHARSFPDPSTRRQ
jgi:nitronate monooxygenase